MQSGSNRELVFRADKPSRFLQGQEQAIRIILNGFYRIATNLLVRGVFKTRRPSAPELDVERPHHVFLIDGARGAGKTYTLLSAELVLKTLSEDMLTPSADGEWPDFLYGGASQQSAQALKDAFKEARASSGVSRIRLAETMKIIFPGDLIVGESLMEAIFARMAESLAADIDELGRKLGRTDDRSSKQSRDRDADDAQRRLADLKLLSKRLQEEVEQGWYFARRFGLDALIRDSSDYGDLVLRWAEESSKASGRIDSWRRFVSDYLDVRDTAMLVVLVDDSDVRQELTEDVLHSIRMFLNHPRIVTVLGGNLKSMRDSLLHLSMQRIGSSIPALNKEDHPTARDWRRRERQTIEEYLEKVLPPAQRIHIPAPRLRSGDGAKADDFQKITGLRMFDYLNNAMTITRKRFLSTKFMLALEHELGRVDAPTDAQRAELENFLAWWFFANMYADVLSPQSARQIATFRDYYEDWYGLGYLALKDEEKARRMTGAGTLHPKRLPVMLYEMSANYTLVHRLSDEDVSVPAWVRRQKLDSSWSGRRLFLLNGRDVHDGSFTYRYLRFRLDVGLGTPIRDNADEVMPAELLPQPLGRKFMRRFFQPRQMPRRHRRIGLSRWIEHAAIPGNCVYFHHLTALPDVSFIDESDRANAERLQSGHWEAQLADRWHELVEDRHERPEDEFLLRYFCEVVCESLRYTHDISSAALIAELDPPDIIEKQTGAIYEYFLRDELDMFGATVLERRYAWLQAFPARPGSDQQLQLEVVKQRLIEEASASTTPAIRERVVVDEQSGAKSYKGPVAKRPRRMIALYAALTTDLRRAWQAIRIYEASPMQMGALEETTRERGQRTSLAVIANRDRMTLYIREDIELLLERSGWTKKCLQVFAKTNILETLEPAFESLDPQAGLTPEAISSIFGVVAPPQSRSEISKEEQISAERRDFERWTKTIRSVVRLFCKNWPVHDKADSAVRERFKDLEDQLFHVVDGQVSATDPVKDPDYAMLKIFREKWTDADRSRTSQQEQELKAADDQVRRSNSRAARNLVWLLYGLAPSLPAVIHAHIMSQIYDAELMAAAYEASKAQAKENPERFDKAARQTFIDTSQTRYRQAIKEIEAWGKLIGSLSVLLRYVKIKCLHLDTALMIGRLAEKTPTGPDRTTDSLSLELVELAGYTLKLQPGLAHGADEARKQCAEEMVALLKGAPDNSWPGFHCSRMAEGLAIFPDVSPSTLFGDRWLKDILSRGGVVDEVVKHFREPRFKDAAATVVNGPTLPEDSDDPLSVNGIFGETEQWLWSANRTLRKLYEELTKRSKKIDEIADDAAKDERPTQAQKARRSRQRTKK
jgi:hypothetical protein